uniref:Reverse transcriptase domain-containing protein n=1 Tax=Triticum urartu TaxID=4572 RepID=A0A8R7UQZ0_TRIUA
MVKIDLAKAFDRIEWDFIVKVLARKGLHGHFINLIYACMAIPTFSVIINGQSYGRFQSSRGIRQGCPLSPYLFVLAINELSISLQEAMLADHLSGIILGTGCPPIHSLMFADDLLICGQATVDEATHMLQILQRFCNLSGQMPNWSKSAIIFSRNVNAINKEGIKRIFPVQDISDSSIYLGHPLILPDKDRSSAYDFVADKFKVKLTGYKANKLSHAARLTLINSVFASIPVYYMSNILFSRKLIAKLTSIIRNFWWTGIKEDPSKKALCLRAWKDICTPKVEGGLGIKNIQAVNRGLILSAAWRIAEEPQSFLSQVLKSKYFPDTSIWRAKNNIPKSGFWASILKVKHILYANSIYQILDGNSSVWSTPWFPHWQSIYEHLQIR